jgi:hypothetical protein
VNALGVADYAGLSPAEVLADWRAASAGNRRRFCERADGVVDTSIGEYPCRWQAAHVAAELATHPDDIGVPTGADWVPEAIGFWTSGTRRPAGEGKRWRPCAGRDRVPGSGRR